MIGRKISPEELYREVEKDKSYYNNSGGGVTLSGGEPTMQLDFIEGFLQICKRNGIATALDTSGFFKWSSFKRIVDLIGLFLYDVKHMDEQAHIKLTGVSNRMILDNLKSLSKRGKEIVVRIPLIPGNNDTQTNIRQSRDFLSALGIKRVDLLPFNELAGSKYRHIGKISIMEGTLPSSAERINQIKQEFESGGIETCVRK
jgi:pyruvate formate lyase activating enzyme